MDSFGGNRRIIRRTQPLRTSVSVRDPLSRARYDQQVIERYKRQQLVKRIRRVARVAIVATKTSTSSRTRKLRQYKHTLQSQLQTLHTNQYRLIAGMFVVVFAISSFIPPLIQANDTKPITLDNQIKALVGESRDDIKDNLKYDAEKRLYSFEVPSETPTENSEHTGRNADAYTTTLPQNANEGVTVTEKKTKIAITLKPDFFTANARKSDGDHIVYRSGAEQIIYTHKYNGLKEDIIVPKFKSKNLSYQFTLDVPAGVEARLDDRGNIGLYSGDSNLFGNMSYGSDEDREKVEKARLNSQKTNLVMTIPYPIVKDSTGTEFDNRAEFELGKPETVITQQTTSQQADLPAEVQQKLTQDATVHRYQLTIKARDLTDLKYPISIDPTMQVTSSADFGKLDLVNATLDTTNNLIKRDGLSGGALGTWGNTGTSLTARYGAAVAVSNGFIYVTGGCVSHLVTTCQAVANGVQKATISTSGIGTWSTETSLPDAVWQHTMLAANGYLYVLSGANNTVPNGSPYIYHIKINANGSLPAAWTQTFEICCQLYSSAFTYNGYLYRLGGSASGALTSAVLYSKINGDGSLGAWATTTAMPAAINEASASVYNGEVYVMGGCTNTNPCSAYTNAVNSARINSDGTLSSWTSRASFTTARRNLTSWVHSGYLYMGAGQTTTALGDVQYAPIYADGSLGAWTTTNSLGATRSYSSAIALNGSLFSVGGLNGTAILSTSEFTQVKPAGETSIITTNGTTHTTGRVWYGSLVHKGFLYVLGGSSGDGTCNATTGTMSDVQYAPINSNGSIGTFVSTTSFVGSELAGAGRCGFGLGTHNGFLYVIGGGSNTLVGATPVGHTDVIYAPFNDNGTLGAWTASTNKFTTARTHNGGVVYNGYVYVIGGMSQSLTYFNDVQYAPINGDGSVGVFSSTTSFPTARAFLTTGVYAGKLYIVGGYNGTSLGDIRYIIINNDGTLDSWQNTTALPGSNALAISFHNSEAYVYGGTNIYRGTVASSGALGAWTQMATTTTNAFRTNYQGGVYGGVLYRMGGCTSFDGSSCNAFTTNLQYAHINNGGSGNIATWSPSASPLSSARGQFSTSVLNGVIYIIGGSTTSGDLSEIIYAALSDQGVLGSWQSSASNGRNLPFTRSAHTSEIHNEYLYVFEGNTADSSRTRYAKLISTGGIASDAGCGSVWCSSTASGTNRSFVPSAYWNSYVYLSGSCVASYCTTVEYAKLLDSGGIAADSGCGSSWCSTTVLTRGRSLHMMIAFADNLYVVGGYTTSTTPNFINTVEYATIGSNGSLGAWNPAPALPNQARNSGLVIMNGYMYVVGGQYGVPGDSTGGTGTVRGTMFAPIVKSGGVGSWQYVTGNYTQARASSGVVNVGGYIVDLGGDNAASTITYYNNVDIAAPQSIPRKAQVSKLYDFDVGVKPTKLITRGTKTSGSVTNVSYSSANNTGTTLDNIQTILDAGYGGASAQTLSLGSSRTLSRYLLLRYTIDDSQSAVFPDAGNESTITDWDVYYTANPGSRLKGGRTFTNGVDRGLDAAPQ